MGRSVNSAAPDAANDHPPDFKTEFHPRSKCPTLFQFAEEFGQQNLECMPPDHEPWCPFALEGDYIFASISVEAGLSSNQVDSLLKLVHCISQGTASFSKFEITAPYKGNDVTFPVHICPLWDWALDLLQNSSLAPHLVWDAQWLFKHDGERCEHFYTEPWTGDRWWDIQSRLPSHVDNAVPFTFIIYTDKTWLSSHGTVKGYPVIAHCVNLPVHVCNGERYGSGCVVGWLPIVPELAKEEGKTGYANFKRVVWHTAFFQLLEKVAELSKVGYLHECYDKVLCWLFPLVLILSADYEELCSKCPCLFCLVPLEQLWDLKKTYEMHTTEQHKRALALFEEKKTVGEKKLKSLGLCPVKNAFWSVEHSEPEQAASFEPLHSLHGGMGGKHIHGELRIVTHLEAQVSAFPCWQGLTHFDTVIHITFSDGNKMRDLTRQCFYASLNILTLMMSRVGYQLLRMISSYLRLDTLIGLDVHTEKTLGMIKDELLIFRDELKLYRSFVHRLDDMDLKDNWNFPKAHLWKHITCDIQSKGVIRNYSAWPNEKMHGPLKDTYQDRSNGKDTAGQILCACINAENKCVNDATNDDEDHNTVLKGNAKLSAPQQTRSLSDVENTNQNDQAFDGFCRKLLTRLKLETFLNTCLPTYGFPLDKWIQLQGTHTVCPLPFIYRLIHIPLKIWEYRYLKVAVNYLRCNPSFHGWPRYNGALIQLSETKTTFIRLIFMFTCKVAVFEDTFQFALVQPLTAGTGVCRLDQDLQLSIIRGALLYLDLSHHGEFLVVEHTDGDMFLRMREWTQTQPQARLPGSDHMALQQWKSQ
ncbi:hypothetical protein BKA82DRAFT_4331799 [Pisolithus tinctorius]|nr:hypothetical protein BKA82DRAFT_4331799 [Pisolithus tinctorius]